MSIPHQKFPENSLKFMKKYQKHGNEISFWAFLLSIFIYIFVFYIFNLSPSSVLNSTKFWFFITNTLILIIAADFGAFSLSKKQNDVYDEDFKTSTRYSHAIVKSQYRDIVNTNIPLVKVESPRESREEIKEIIHVDGGETKPLEHNLQIVLKNDFEKLSEKCLEDAPLFTHQAVGDFEPRVKKKDEATFVRTMSELPVPVKGFEDKSVFRKSVSEKYDTKEETEFSTMSTDELNRRVEEFIRRSHKQIRLEAARIRIRQV